MTKPNKLVIALVFFSLLAVSACNKNTAADKFVTIPNGAWDYKFQPEIEVDVPDRNKTYRIYVNFRHSNQYKYANAFLLVHRNQIGHSDTSFQRIELKLAESDGRWLGKHSGDLYSHQQLIEDNYKFPDTGKFVFSVEQNMRDNPLLHVNAAGIRVELTD